MSTVIPLNQRIQAFDSAITHKALLWTACSSFAYIGVVLLQKYTDAHAVLPQVFSHTLLESVRFVLLALLMTSVAVFFVRVITAFMCGYDVFSRDYKDGSLAHLIYTHNHLQPHHGTEYSAGWDLRANIGENATIDIEPGMQAVLGTGVKMVANNDMANGYFGMLVPRSSLSKKGLIIPNSVGIIDRDYSGEIKVVFNNISDQVVTIEDGERIAQIICVPFMPLSAREVERDEWNREDLNGDTRGAGGFGSTGDK